MNRRFISAALAGALLLGLAPSAAQADEQQGVAMPATPAPPMMAPPGSTPAAPPPEPKITSAEAEAALRALFTLPQQTEKVDLQWTLSRYGQKASWELQVTVREGNGASGFGLAAVDGMTGRVLRYGAYGSIPGPVRTGPLTSVRSEDEARVRAWALVQKVAPEWTAFLKEAPTGTPGSTSGFYPYGSNNSGDSYQFTWVEHHGGIPFPASNVSVGVHKQTLAYTNLHVNLTESIQFQSGPAKVTPEEALKLWQAEAKPTLAYQPDYAAYPNGPSKAIGFKLLYSFGNLGRPIDALTGDWAKDQNPFAPPGNTAPEPAEPEPVPAGDVTPVVAGKLPLDDTSAQQLAISILEVPVGAQLRPELSPFSDEKLLGFHFFDRGQSGSIQFEPKTGLIRSANRYPVMGPTAPPQGGSGAPSVTPEQEAAAKAAAFAVVQTYYSQLRADLKLDTPSYWGPSDNRTRRFRFVRYIGGLPLPTDSVSVTIDLTTMKWADMNASWTSGVTLPDPAAAIPASMALKVALGARKPMLIYRPIYPAMRDEDRFTGRMPTPTEAVLAYVLAPELPSQVDALTGKPAVTDGQADIQAAYAKVTGHWAEGELQFMLAQRALRPDELNPSAPLTRGQAAGFLLHRNPSLYRSGPRPVELLFTDLPETDPAYGAVRMGWSEGWLRPLDGETAFRPDALVTRAEFVVWLARALGLGDLARSSISVGDGFTDLEGLTPEQANAASFLRALGLLSPADRFRGAAPLTQAEGAALTVRAYNYALTE